MKLKAVILRNEMDSDHIGWIRACEEFSGKVAYRVVDLTAHDWLEAVQSEPFDLLLAKPGGLTALFKQLYDERIYILSGVYGYTVFPSPEEIFIYENKKLLSYWLKAKGIPHPSTTVFYNRDEALDHVSGCQYPLVAKTSIGASGSGVRILRSAGEAVKYIDDTFRGKGAPQRSGPNTDKGGLFIRGLHYLKNPADIPGKLNIYQIRAASAQKGFVIFQEYVEHDYEWRVVRIGDSYFAHKKLKAGDKASGALLKNYDNPPVRLFDFAMEITESNRFYSQAIDLFETDRGFLVNEMQCIFGQSDNYQMMVDNKPGRYIRRDGSWLFQEGDFARNECYNLRLQFLIDRHEGTVRM